MKHHHTPRGGRLIVGLLTGLLAVSSALADIPTGKLFVDRTLVRVGSRSQLDWNIQYPYCPVGVDLIPTNKVKMTVRVLGVAHQSGFTPIPVEGSWTKNSSPWSNFFRGAARTVVPTNVLVESTVKRGDRIKFRARGGTNAIGTLWYNYHETNNSDPYVAVLKNGDRPPTFAPNFAKGRRESFLTPYIDTTGRIKIGPDELIILWECSQESPDTPFFDMQDLVVLVSFEAITQ